VENKRCFDVVLLLNDLFPKTITGPLHYKHRESEANLHPELKYKTVDLSVGHVELILFHKKEISDR
jgi:hypothetical protein